MTDHIDADHSGWPEHMRIARGELGVHELPGKADNPRIVEYLRATALPESLMHDSTAHCAAFVCWVMQQAGKPNPRFARARDWLTYSEPCGPELGAIAVFSRGPNPAQGHVAFLVAEHPNTIEVLGANQHDSVCFEAYAKDRLLGYRKVPA